MSVAGFAAPPASARIDHSAASGLPRALTVGVTLASALASYVLLTHATFNPLYVQTQPPFGDDYFYAQAHSIIHGHLNVAPVSIPLECWIYHGKCFGYFGITPSLLRIPLLPLLNATGHGLTAVYMTAALTLAVGSALAICSRILRGIKRSPLVDVLAGALAISAGPASVLAAIARPAVYEEAIAWSVAFALLGVYCFLRWWTSLGRGWAALLLLSLVLSANARPTTAALAAALGAGVVVRAILHGSAGKRSRRMIVFGGALAVLPFATCAGIYWLKFHTLVPSLLLNQQVGGPAANAAWLSIRHADHNQLSGLRFLPSALVAYLRPDGVHLSSAFPFVDFRFGPGLAGVPNIGLAPGSFFVEQFSTVPDDMPVAVMALVAGLAVLAHRTLRRWVGIRPALAQLFQRPETYVLLGTAGSAVVMMSQVSITNRYLADFFPFVVVVMAVCLRLTAPVAARLSGWKAIAVGTVVTALVAWALVFNFGLEYQWWWHTALPGTGYLLPS
jgi:hypothetical protein